MRPFSFNLYVNKNKLIFRGLIAFMIGLVVGGALWHFGGVYTESPLPSLWTPHVLQRFSSYEELKNFLNKTSQVPQNYPYRNIWPPPWNQIDLSSETAQIDYSTTNIQIGGVDEIDIVKTDGTYIYVVSGKSVVIVRAYPPEHVELVSRLDFNQTVRGIFVNGEKLVVFQGGFDRYGIVLWGRFALPESYVVEGARTSIKIYDISDRSTPKLDGNVTVDGYYFSSRMIGDYVYAVINKPAYLNNSEVALPAFYFDSRIVEINASSIYYANVSDYCYTFTNIVAINVQNPEQEPTHETFLLGAASDIYVSQKNLYLTSTPGANVTGIHKINIESGEIKYVADGEVPGHVLNQFSMDEHEDHFRVATTKGQIWAGGTASRNNVYVLNANLSIVGKLENLAPGEKVHSARFMGDRCYLVTFRKVDPLFVIDLQDPENPHVLGKLKIPGYSDYLHPYDDTHLIGVGKETVPAEEGDFSWYQGVKISIFDVSNVSKPKRSQRLRSAIEEQTPPFCGITRLSSSAGQSSSSFCPSYSQR